MTLFPALKFSHLVPTKYVYLNRLLTIAIQKKTAYNEVVGNIVCVGQSELPFGWLFLYNKLTMLNLKIQDTICILLQLLSILTTIKIKELTNEFIHNS